MEIFNMKRLTGLMEMMLRTEEPKYTCAQQVTQNNKTSLEYIFM